METSILQVVDTRARRGRVGPRCRRRRTADRGRRATDAAQPDCPAAHGPISATTRSFASSSRRGFDRWTGPTPSRPSTGTRRGRGGTDWRTAAHHYREAGDIEAMLGVVAGAIPTIMGNGQYALAEAFIGPIAAERRPAGFDPDPQPRRHAARRLRSGDRREPAVLDQAPERPHPARPCAAQSGHARHELRRRRPRHRATRATLSSTRPQPGGYRGCPSLISTCLGRPRGYNGT